MMHVKFYFSLLRLPGEGQMKKNIIQEYNHRIGVMNREEMKRHKIVSGHLLADGKCFDNQHG